MTGILKLERNRLIASKLSMIYWRWGAGLWLFVGSCSFCFRVRPKIISNHRSIRFFGRDLRPAVLPIDCRRSKWAILRQLEPLLVRIPWWNHKYVVSEKFFLWFLGLFPSNNLAWAVMAQRFGHFYLRVSCLSQKRPILLALFLRFLRLWLWFAFRKLLNHIFG
jgi:hypothetical protein